MGKKLLSDLKGRISNSERRRREAEEKAARSHLPGAPARPQGLTRQERNVWAEIVNKLTALRKVYTDNGALVLQYVRAKMRRDTSEMRRLTTLFMAQETWPETEAKIEQETEQETTSITLAEFLEKVAEERCTFADRMRPDATVVGEFDWPAGHSATTARDYAAGITQGSIIAGDLMHRAAARFLDDLETGCSRGLWFDPEAVANACAFAETFCALKLMPWQVFVFANIFGWKKASGARRFTEAFISVSRKNGKTCLASTVALFCLVADQERHPEVYSCATKRDQARICWRDARRAVLDSAELQTEVHVWAHELTTADDGSFTPLASEEKSLDGLRVHMACLDELHAWEAREVFDRLMKGTVSRTQPLILEITTAGQDKNTFCWSKQDLCEKILRGVFRDDSTFCAVYSIDKDDDYRNENIWLKANPSLENRAILKVEHLRKSLAEVEQDPNGLNAFLRSHLNVWPDATLRRHGSIPVAKWEACAGFDLIGTTTPGDAYVKFMQLNVDQPVFGGLDLGGTSDLSACALLWPKARFTEGGEVLNKKVAIVQCWMPEDGLLKKEKKWRVPLSQWVREGWLDLLPGDLTDPRLIKKAILENRSLFSIRDVGYDPWTCKFVAAEMFEQGLLCTEVLQTAAVLTMVVRDFIGAVSRGEVVHFGNPLLSWMASNVVFAENEKNGGVLPEKLAPPDSKIDAISAILDAWHRMMAAPAPIDRGIVVLDLQRP